MDNFYKAIIGYLIISLLTFGWASNNSQKDCLTETHIVVPCYDVKVVNGLMKGIVWPLYWTHKAFWWAQ